MHIIDIHKVDTDPLFKLKFQPLDSLGQPADPTGAVVVTADGTNVVSGCEPAGPGSATFNTTLAHVVGTQVLTFHDDLFSVQVNVIVGSGAETDATVIEVL